MKTLKEEYVREAMDGCVNNNYKLICRAGRIVQGFSEGIYDIDVEDNIKRYFKASLYRKFMRAYARYILANPNCIDLMASDLCINSMANGESTGIID